jgi:predicted acetylornithine/succinylornithine family transaminase
VKGGEERTSRLIDSASATLFPNYRQFPVVFERGEGSTLFDTEGRSYLDFVAGIATCNLGHCHPAVTEAISEQAARLVHVSNWYYNDRQAVLAEKLTSLTGLDKVFFCNSGAEASEAAIKLARKFSWEKHGEERSLVISLHGAFHGRTMKALTATDPKHHHQAFSPYPEGFAHIERDDLEALTKLLPGACALFVEPVQGEGGVYPLDHGFLRAAAAACRDHGVLLMMDEVQTGMGRCGSLFAHELYDVEPDVMTLAKGLANGFPVGAVLATGEAAAALGPGTHGSTFGGNPLACAAAEATLRVIEEDKLARRAMELGAHLEEQLDGLVRKHTAALEVRGAGLLQGLQVSGDPAEMVSGLLDQGILVTAVAGHTIRLTPPLTVSREEINMVIKALDEALGQAEGQPG